MNRAWMALALLTTPWTALADGGTPPETSSDTRSPHTQPGEVRTRPFEAEASVGASFDSQGTVGGAFRGRLRLPIQLGDGTIDGPTATYGALFDPGVTLRVNGTPQDPFRRHELQVTGLGALRIRGEVRAPSSDRVRLTAEQREWAEQFRRNAQRIRELRAQLDRGYTYEDMPRRHEWTDELARLARESESLFGRLQTALPRAQLRAEDILNDDIRDQITTATGDVTVLHGSYVRRRDAATGFSQDAGLLEAVSLSGHVAARVTPTVSVDFCGGLSPGGLVLGSHRVGERQSLGGWALSAMACAGIGVANIGHLRDRAEFSMNILPTGNPVAAQRYGFENNLTLERIGGSPVQVGYTYQYDHTETGTGESRGVQTHFITAGVAN